MLQPIVILDFIMPKNKVVTRKQTEVFLFGQGNPEFPSAGKLPLAADVMRYLLYRKQLPEFKISSTAAVICCPLKTGTQDARCLDPGGCCDPDQGAVSKCVVAKLKYDGHWAESGLPVIKDQNILGKVLNIHDTKQKLTKNKSRQSSAEEVKRNEFKIAMESLFDISAPDIIEKIEKDRLRSEQAKKEDLDFLMDQRGPRKMCIGARDEVCDKKVAAKIIRDKRGAEPKPGGETGDLVVSEHVAGGSKARPDDDYPASEKVPSDKFEDYSSGNDDEFEIPAPRKSKKSEIVTLAVNSRKLAKLTSVTCKRYKIGTRAQSDILTNVIVAGGASTESIPCSRSSVRRAGITGVIGGD